MVAVEDKPAATTALTPLWSNYLKRLYLFALVWSVGALLERPDRARLDEYIRSQLPQLALPPATDNQENTVFDFVVGSDGTWYNTSITVY